MGEVLKPENLLKARKKMIDDALRDLTPGVREPTKRLLEAWRDKESKKELITLVGEKAAKQLLKKLTLD